MALNAETLRNSETLIDGLWVAAKPFPQPFKLRLYDAWLVLCGRAEAVVFWRQP